MAIARFLYRTINTEGEPTVDYRILCLIAMLFSACTDGAFQEGKDAKSTEVGVGAADASNGRRDFSEPPFKEPLDLSVLEVNEAEREAGGPTPGAEAGFGYGLDLSCEQTLDYDFNISSDSDSLIRTKGDQQVVMNVRGRFCPGIVTQNLTVLFLIDFSGSMGLNGGDDPFLPPQGNDPRFDQNGQETCGRLLAAQVIMNRFKASDAVEVGSVPFASSVVSGYGVAPLNHNEFRQGYTEAENGLKHFCSHLSSDPNDPLYADAPGAIEVNGIDGRTNYEAAFRAARNYLDGRKGQKVVYFITDGRPTAPGDEDSAIDAAKRAAQALMDLDNVIVNSFFLQNLNVAQEDTTGYEILVDIIGNPNRVKKVANATDLAVEVGKALPVSFDADAISATLSVAPYRPEEPLGVVSFVKDPIVADAWLFETQPFVLLGNPGETVLNQVKIEAIGSDMSRYTATVKGRYQRPSSAADE